MYIYSALSSSLHPLPYLRIGAYCAAAARARVDDELSAMRQRTPFFAHSPLVFAHTPSASTYELHWGLHMCGGQTKTADFGE